VKKVNVAIIFLLILMALSPIIAIGVNAQILIGGNVSTITVESPSVITSGDTFDVRVYVNSNGNEVAGCSIQLSYDKRILEPVNVREGSFLIGRAGNTTIFMSSYQGSYIEMNGIIITKDQTVTDPGVFVVVTFRALDFNGVSPLELFNCTVTGVDAVPYPVELLSSRVKINLVEEENPDIDGDGIFDTRENCPNVSNPRQLDNDRDGLGNECDSCPNDYYNDMDRDGVCGNEDNCPSIYNPDQLDLDEDGFGNFCDIIDDSKPTWFRYLSRYL